MKCGKLSSDARWTGLSWSSGEAQAVRGLAVLIYCCGRFALLSLVALFYVFEFYLSEVLKDLLCPVPRSLLIGGRDRGATKRHLSFDSASTQFSA